MAKPKASDLDTLTVKYRPVTYCVPPLTTRQTCPLEARTHDLSAADARQHALDHPGHVVIRDVVARTTYELSPQPLPKLPTANEVRGLTATEAVALAAQMNE